MAQATDRALTRLTCPTVDIEAVPPEIVRATISDLQQALEQLGAGEVWDDGNGE